MIPEREIIWPSETSKCRPRILKYCTGNGIDIGPGDYAFAPRGIVHAYIVRSERARMLVTMSPGGLEQLFIDCGLPVADHEQPAEHVLPPIAELARLFGARGCDIVGPPPALADL